MTPTEIKVSLLRAGLSQSELAREYGCSPVVVHQVIMGKGQSRPLKRFLAQRLGVPLKKLFPQSLAA